MNRLKTVKGVSVALVASVLVGALPAHAQQADIDALKAQIAEMTSRLEKLELDAKTVASKEKATPAATSKFPVTVSGLLQVQGNTLFDQSGPTAPTPDTFRLRRTEIRLAGKINSRVSGWVMIDPAKSLSINSVTVPAGGGAVVPTINQSSNILQELVLSYQVKRGESGAHYLDAGQFKIPVGYEGDQVSSSALPFINRALMFSVRDPFAGGYGDIRETGVRLRGSMSQFSYDVGAFNGFGDRQNALALSDTKAIMGRLSYRPKLAASAVVQDLVFGVSGATGNTGVAAGGRADRTLLNAFAAYKRDKLSAQAEYLQGDSQPLGGGSTRDIRSYYGSVGFLFNPKLEAVARYDYFNANRNAPGFDVKDISLGLNYYIKGHNAKIQANVVHRNGTGVAVPAAGASSSGLGSIANDSTAFILQGQVAF